LQVALHAFGAEPTLVKRKLLPRLEADHVVVFYEQFDAALHSAKTAMRLDHTIRLAPAGKALGGWIIFVRSELGEQLLVRGG
jgi:hypothetical protein